MESKNTDLLVLGAISALVAWYGVKWWQARSAPPPVVDGPAGTGALCSPEMVGLTIWQMSSVGFTTGLLGGGVITPAAWVASLVGGISGAVAGIGHAIANKKICDQAVCTNIQVAYNKVLSQGPGGGRIAHLLNLVHSARRQNKDCNGMTNTAGLIVGA